jgi:hypothetical protein
MFCATDMPVFPCAVLRADLLQIRRGSHGQWCVFSFLSNRCHPTMASSPSVQVSEAVTGPPDHAPANLRCCMQVMCTPTSGRSLSRTTRYARTHAANSAAVCVEVPRNSMLAGTSTISKSALTRAVGPLRDHQHPDRRRRERGLCVGRLCRWRARRQVPRRPGHRECTTYHSMHMVCQAVFAAPYALRCSRGMLLLRKLCSSFASDRRAAHYGGANLNTQCHY